MSKPITKAKVRLTQSIDSSSSTISFTATDSTRSLTSVTMSDFGTYGYVVINPTGKSNNYEVVRFESWNTSGSTITIGTLTRNLELEGDDTSGTGLSFPAGTIGIISDNHHWFNNVVLTEGTQTVAGDKTFSGVITLGDSSQLATSAAPTADADIANKKYVDDTAISGAADATTTVKGIVEIATDAELAAGTGTGGTGAATAATGSSFNETAAAGKVPVAESTGQLGEDWIGLTTAGDLVYSDGTDLTRLAIGTASQQLTVNSGATAPEWADAPTGVESSFTAGETINGATLPVAVYQSDSDNEFYACDADDTDKMKFLGFATSNGTDGNPIDVKFTGIVAGFTGLSEGEKYYVQDDKTIGTSPGTNEVLVGVAVSETQLVIMKGRRYASGTVSFNTTTTEAVVCGFRPSHVDVRATDASQSSHDQSFGGWTVMGGNRCAYTGDSGSGLQSTRAWYLKDSGIARHEGTVTSITDTGFTLSNTETGSATDAYISWVAYGDF